MPSNTRKPKTTASVGTGRLLKNPRCACINVIDSSLSNCVFASQVAAVVSSLFFSLFFLSFPYFSLFFSVFFCFFSTNERGRETSCSADHWVPRTSLPRGSTGSASSSSSSSDSNSDYYLLVAVVRRSVLLWKYDVRVAHGLIAVALLCSMSTQTQTLLLHLLAVENGLRVSGGLLAGEVLIFYWGSNRGQVDRNRRIENGENHRGNYFVFNQSLGASRLIFDRERPLC